jgi:hypothetical protein
MPPIKAPLFELVELEVTPLPELDPPAAVAEAPGEFAVAMGLGLPPLLVAAEPPVAAATVRMLEKGTNLAINGRNSKRAEKSK